MDVRIVPNNALYQNCTNCILQNKMATRAKNRNIFKQDISCITGQALKQFHKNVPLLIERLFYAFANRVDRDQGLPDQGLLCLHIEI